MVYVNVSNGNSVAEKVSAKAMFLERRARGKLLVDSWQSHVRRNLQLYLLKNTSPWDGQIPAAMTKSKECQ